MPSSAKRFSWIRRHKGLIKLFGLGIFAYILAQIDLRQSFEILGQARLGWVLLALALGVPAILTKAVRWWSLLRSQAIALSLWDTLSLYCIGLFGGFVTPGQLGDFVKAYYLRRGGQSLTKSLSSVLYDRLFDVLVFLLFGLAGAAVIFGVAFQTVVWALLGAAALLGLGRIRGPLLERGARLYRHSLRPRLSATVQSRVAEFAAVSQDVFQKRLFGKLLLYSVAAMALYLLRVYLLARALGMEIGPVDLLAGVAVVQVITLVPVSVADIGTRDGGLILLLGRFGVAQEMALSLSLLILLLAVENGLIGLGFWLGRRTRAQLSAGPAESRWSNAVEEV